MIKLYLNKEYIYLNLKASTYNRLYDNLYYISTIFHLTKRVSNE